MKVTQNPLSLAYFNERIGWVIIGMGATAFLTGVGNSNIAFILTGIAAALFGSVLIHGAISDVVKLKKEASS